jgi:hypothetical protein
MVSTFIWSDLFRGSKIVTVYYLNNEILKLGKEYDFVPADKTFNNIVIVDVNTTSRFCGMNSPILLQVTTKAILHFFSTLCNMKGTLNHG